MIKVSICIPVFNRETMIERAIMSAVNQDYGNIEIIVVDNNSSDGTLSKVKTLANIYENIKIYKNITNLGALRNFEIAIKHSTGEYVNLLGSDDWIESSYISKKIEIIKKHPKIAIVSGGVKIYNQVGKELKLYSQYNYNSHYMSKEYINLNFYKKFIISYFCIFRRDLILNNFSLDYEDSHNWGVYKKGLGLDLINCLDIANKTKDFLAFYCEGGSYCFCNVEERESNNIIKSYGTDNVLAKTIMDYKYNCYILYNHLIKFNTKSAKKFMIYRNRELLYEIIKKIAHKDFYKLINFNEYKEYKAINNLNSYILLWQIFTLPFYIVLRVFRNFRRNFEL